MGCYEISLGDTLGVGSPADVRWLITYLNENGVPSSRLAGHFHDTYDHAVSNVWEAYKCGVTVFDSSVNGLGGCPFAPNARGNVATQKLVRLFQAAGVETGVNIRELETVGEWLSQALGKQVNCRSCHEGTVC